MVKLFSSRQPTLVKTHVRGLPFDSMTQYVRVHTGDIDGRQASPDKFYRHDYVVVTNEKNGFRLVRQIAGPPSNRGGETNKMQAITKEVIGLSYEDRIALDVVKDADRHDATISIRLANRVEIMRWYLNHERLDFRWAAQSKVLGLVGLMLGIISLL